MFQILPKRTRGIQIEIQKISHSETKRVVATQTYGPKSANTYREMTPRPRKRANSNAKQTSTCSTRLTRR